MASQVASNVSKYHRTSKGTSNRFAVARNTTKSIKAMRASDVLPTRDLKTGKLVYRTVKHVFKRLSDHLIVVELGNKAGKVLQTIKTTRQHPFYVNGKGFVPAGGLAVGNAIVTRAGPPLLVTSIHWLRRLQGYKVYNLEVETKTDNNGRATEDTHNYFVGNANGGVLVHNSCFNRGGRFGDLDAMRDPGEVGHHMQQNAANGAIGRSRNDGPALGMTTDDHALTRTFRGRGLGTINRERHLTPLDRIQLDIQDIKTLFGKKYNKGLKEMIKYAKTLPEYKGLK